ncbi:MAG: TRAP transporter small permease subunit [Deltaproteobacteria bacterium]|nr:TRAP transporter small permease subunit [Deltaproteobacteria bacterium]MBW2122561.1 TRAP transporter small permease subunit [Deltaproteobacteria bacterium]
MGALRESLRRWTEALGRLEEAALICLVLAMVGLASIQIFLRIFFSSGIIWAAVALRHLVLWVAMSGAVMATHESRHIKIDILARFLKGRQRVILAVLIDFFSALICLLLALASIRFVRGEFLFDTRTFLQIPGWIVVLIFPLAFFAITFHFGLNGLIKILNLGESGR